MQIKFNLDIRQKQQQHHQNTIAWIKSLEMRLMSVPFNTPSWNALPAFPQPVHKNKNGRKSILYSKSRANKNTGYCVLLNSKVTTAENVIEGLLATKFLKEFNEHQYLEDGFVSFVNHAPAAHKIKRLIRNPMFFEKIHMVVKRKNLIFLTWNNKH